MEHASYLASNMSHKQQLVATMCSHPQHMEQRWTLKKQYSNKWKYMHISKLHVNQLVWQYLKMILKWNSQLPHIINPAHHHKPWQQTNDMDYEPAATI